MNTWGVFISFGVFQSYYIPTLALPPSTISWIGSTSVFLLFLAGSAAGVLTDAGFFRATVASGAALVVLGTFATSVSTTAYWHVFLAQGVCTGLGNGLLFAPSMTVVSTYFARRRGVALAVAASGSSVGGLVFPSMARTLLPRVGFGWTMRAIGFVQLGTLAVGLAVARTREMPRGKGPLFDWAAWREPEYALYAVGAFLTFIGIFFPFFYLASYARDIQHLSYPDSLNLLLVLNGVGVVARLFPGFLALWVGTYNVFIVLVAITSLTLYCWAAVSSLGGLYAWTVFFSLSMGGVQALFPAALAALKFDAQKQGTRMGMLFAVIGFGCLIGPPISGVLIRNSGGDYLDAQMFSGSCMVAGLVLLVAAREVKRRREGLKLLAKI
ncbi:major facilitator superfamily domain-containing protein [Parachaetomium inaequale]|uniref:Major facilitator superfamily domain-containing protein n=1 Tax=Parachaetomium inaequale TaxID=2588326 RepID=A0AAN6PKI0_9PEZI|nr:major facilitator superfamily domain-containing protein [Parachaetomium inaequale]